MDPSSLCTQGVTQSEAGHGNGGLNQGGSGLPLECSGIDQVRPSLGSQLQQSFLEASNQFQLLQQQEWRQEQEQERQPRLQELWRQRLQLLQPRQPLLQQHQLHPRGESSFDDINGIESLKVGSKCKEKLWSNTSSAVDNDFDHSDEMGSDEINLIGSQTSKVKSKSKKKCRSSVWKSYMRITEKDGKERAQCIRCGKKYLIDSRRIGTSTLNRHEKDCSRNETRDVGQLEPRDQGPEPIQEENIIEVRTPERWWTLSSPASGVLGTTPAVTTKRRRLAEMHTESDESIWSKTSAFRPTSHDSANKSAGTEADGGKSSTPPAATEEEVQASRDLQLSLATTKSGPQEESGSVHKQFASAEELRSIAERKKALKITLNGILDSLWKGQIECLGRYDSLWKGQIECLGSYESAVDVVLSTLGSAVDVNPLEAIFTELFASLKEWQSIQDPASLFQNEVLDRVAILEREFDEEDKLADEEARSWVARRQQMDLYEQESQKHREIILSSLHELEVLDRTMLRRELDEERELENEEQSSWIDRCRREMLLDMDKSLEHKDILLTEDEERVEGIEARVASKLDRLHDFRSMVDGILGEVLESADPEVAAQRYAAHKREAMKGQLQDISRKINDFFKE